LAANSAGEGVGLASMRGAQARREKRLTTAIGLCYSPG
jgi:hypothetical protein